MSRKILAYCAGLLVMAMGVSFSGKADLGMSPVNSIPYVLSEVFTALSMGTWIIIIFSLYILLQFAILGRQVEPARLLQLICTNLFGFFTNFTNLLADAFLPGPAACARRRIKQNSAPNRENPAGRFLFGEREEKDKKGPGRIRFVNGEMGKCFIKGLTLREKHK